MRQLACLIALLLCAAGTTRADSMSSLDAAPSREPLVLQVKDFVHNSRTLGDGAWEIEKFQAEDGLWRARLRVDGVVRENYGDCGEREDWMRFLVWPDSVPTAAELEVPRMLFVLRYGGGANGREHLNIVDLDHDYRSLFATRGAFNFRRMEDLDDDGRLEVIGSSRRFEGVLDLSANDSPYPVLVLSYDGEAGRYLCQTDRFPQDSEEAIARFETAFELNRPVDRKVPFAPDDASVHERQFAPLVRWAVELCYTGRTDEAWRLLEASCTPEAAGIARDAIADILAEDRYYQELIGNVQESQ